MKARAFTTEIGWAWLRSECPGELLSSGAFSELVFSAHPCGAGVVGHLKMELMPRV
jgi:hypothetical protein